MIKANPQMTSSIVENMSLDLTSMLDVIFMLLVFFILTANSVQHALKVDLPTKGADQASPVNEEGIITLTLLAGNNRWAVNDETLMNWSEVEQTLLEARNIQNKSRFMIAGDRQVSMENFLQALAFFKREKIAITEVLMQPNQTKPVKNTEE